MNDMNGPSAEADPRFAIGGNFPPSPPTAYQVTVATAAAHTMLAARRDELVRAIEVFLNRCPVIETDDQAAMATENIAMLGKAARMAEDQRKAAKEPYLEGGRAVDLWFAGVKASLDKALGAIRPPATAYSERKEAESRRAAQAAAERAAAEARAAADAAAQAAAALLPEASGLFDTAIATAKASEAAHAHAAARPAAHSRTTGTYGSVSSLVETWNVEVDDPSLVPREYLCVDREALRRAVAAGVRAIPGCSVYSSKSLRTR